MTFIRRTPETGLPRRSPSKRKTKTEIFTPTKGLHTGLAPQQLPPGFTPESQNFVARNGFLTPRSGLSQFGTYTLTGPVLGAFEVFDIDGELAAFAASEDSIAYIHPDSGKWSSLSYIKGSTLASDNNLSGLSTDNFSAVPIYEKDSDDVIAVASNATDWMKWFTVDGSTTTFSDFTWINSLDSMKNAEAVTAINDRLVFFNLNSSEGTAFPTRVLWSARGAALDFTLDAGAGFEDLLSMRGKGQAAVPFQDFLILFTDQEVWRAQPTLDDYAFRFERITDKVGCPWQKTAVATPMGVFFLGRDFEVYVTDGVQVLPIGPIGGRGPSRIQKLIENKIATPTRSWALFNQIERRYELYFPDADSVSGFPNHALFYHIDDDNWFHQTFAHELSSGFDFEDPGTKVAWNDLSKTWNETLAGWDSFGDSQGARWATTFSSDGTIYRFQPYGSVFQASGGVVPKILDDGEPIDARWQSHGLRQGDAMRQTNLREIWIDYEIDPWVVITGFNIGTNSYSTSTNTDDTHLNVYVGSAQSGRDFDSGTSVSLQTNESPAFAPVWKTSNAPIFEIRSDNGLRPRISRFQAILSDAGQFKGGV